MSRHLKFSLKIMPFVLGCAIILVMMRLESFLFPMANSFELTSVIRHTNKLVVTGHYTLGRECMVVGGNFWAEGKTRVHLDVHLDDSSIYQYPKKIKQGIIYFGQWEIDYQPEYNFDKIHYELQYKCHPFWINSIEMFQFTAPKPLFQKGVFFGDELYTNIAAIQP